jgi:hypothetical protein
VLEVHPRQVEVKRHQEGRHRGGFGGIRGRVGALGDVAVVDALFLPARVGVLEPLEATERVLVPERSFEQVLAPEVAVGFGLDCARAPKPLRERCRAGRLGRARQRKRKRKSGSEEQKIHREIGR